MAARRSTIVLFALFLLAPGALAQDAQPALTPAGQSVLRDRIAAGRQSAFPLSTCMFAGGLCGAVNRDGTTAVPPRYDWIGPFKDGRAAIRIGGLYGFVDEDGREVVRPQYRIVDAYKLGFAQVDVDGKSGLIDRDGNMVVEPKYGFIEAIGPDRFRVAERARRGGTIGSENFSGTATLYTADGGISMTAILDLVPGIHPMGVMDTSGRWIEQLMPSRAFDKDDPSIRWVQRDGLWGLSRSDGNWLVEPKFQAVGPLVDGLANVSVNGKVGFIDRGGTFAIAPVFDRASSFKAGFDRTPAQLDDVVGVIDRTGAWP